jgi:hypothetical protein
MVYRAETSKGSERATKHKLKKSKNMPKKVVHVKKTFKEDHKVKEVRASVETYNGF